MGTHIEVIARGLLIDRGRILACQNVKKGYYYLPGGHVEHGERVREALRREFTEECGVEIIVSSLAGVVEAAFAGNGKRLTHEVNMVFHVERRGRGHFESLEPAIAFEWLPVDSLHDQDLRPEAIRDWLANRSLDGAPIFLSDFSTDPKAKSEKRR